MKLNLPNKITLSRICLTPVVIFFYLANFIPFHHLIAAVLFVFAVSTDFLDGYLARKHNMVTNLGKFLDPIADKLINVSVILLLVADGTIMAPWGVLFAIVLVGRELAVGGLRQIAATRGVVIAADKWGKWKTLVQDIALPLFMVWAFVQEMGYAANFYTYTLQVLSYEFAGLALILTVISFANYFVKNKQVFQSES